MGVLLNVKDFIESTIEIRKEIDYSIYSRFLESHPIFVTYYKINLNFSTTDQGFESIVEYIGPNSPVKYNKIKNFFLFGVQNTTLEINIEDINTSIEFTSDAIVLPNTIIPVPNDFFSINYIYKKYLFKIINVEVDTIKSNNFYKITFEYSKPDDVQIQNQVYETYEAVLENIGTEYNVILSEDVNIKENYLKKIYNSIRDKYIEAFYVKKLNSFIIEIEGLNIYNKYFIKFCKDNKLFKDHRDFNTIHFDIYSYIEKNFINIYQKTIYRALETKDISIFEYPDCILLSMNNVVSSIFYRKNKTYYDIRFCKLEEPNNLLLSMNLIDPQLKNKIINNENSDDLIFKILIKYFNNEIIKIEDFKFLENYDMNYNLYNYMYIPLILYIINNLRENIIIKN